MAQSVPFNGEIILIDVVFYFIDYSNDEHVCVIRILLHYFAVELTEENLIDIIVWAE